MHALSQRRRRIDVRATWYATAMREKEAPRLCAWCEKPIRRAARRDAKTCSKSCRQKLHRFRVAPAALDGSTKPMRFGYADPPYPGLARRYYGCAEVDHAKLVREMASDFPDGWALSTSASAAFDVLQLVRRVVDPKRVRVCIWVKGSRKGITYSARNAYEVLIVVRGRSRRLGVAEDLDDVLLWGGRQHSHPRALVGMKPAAFCEWLFRLLGAAPGDHLVDRFPGSGAVTRAWKMFTSCVDDATATRLPSRFAGAAVRMSALSSGARPKAKRTARR